MPDERQFSGAVLRADVAWLEKNGLKQAVRERVPADTQALLDKPPLPISWVSGRHVDALLEAVVAAAGEDKGIQLGEETTRSSLGPLVRPLLRRQRVHRVLRHRCRCPGRGVSGRLVGLGAAGRRGLARMC
jgi:hypothetical protein